MGSVPEQSRPASIHLKELEVQGFVNEGSQVTNYLGIQYATIPARFRQAEPIDHLGLTGVLDATHYGARCPQNPRPKDLPLFEGLQKTESPNDEFGCLRLNIFTPAAQQSRPLPVLVWIHGGGFVFGDGGWEFDGNHLVQHAVESGKPMVFVTLNYRLGYFGFLTSKELKEEAAKDGQKPFSNMAFYDQRLALLWIQNHIQFFGGDPSNVTIAGESAGGLSVLAHLRSDVPVCQRGMIMSSPNLDYPRPEESQATFDKLVASTGVSPSASPDEKLAALRALSSDDILKLIGFSFSTPHWDPEWLVHQDGTTPTAGPAPLSPWVKGVLIGSTKDEAAIFGIGMGWQTWTSNQFEERVKSVVQDEKDASELMRAYGIDSSASAETNMRGLIDMVTDTNFSGLPFIVAEQQTSTPPISIYRFEQRDPFPKSPFHGYAYHSLDNGFFCRYPSIAGPSASEDARETANRFNGAVLDFVYGEQPWEIYWPHQKIMVFNGKGSGLEKADQPDRWRRIFAERDGTKTVRRYNHKLMGLGHDSLP
ncbi:hypothetical protein LTR99_003242 [Exophiala xenobiotica]|uniref:Carboxylic ester hydrolase n=1 Tax=Vermiconidia calcicola TaxID=1690605 RepID=A0AAV9QES7_9PEZI|nr:hypothetical protein H2202_006080 [Exophiala xenobiotica]KAK5538908.1 hypothetical protein LTR25_004452 [Vermiconidia calcicola]KAK5540522.1 hypothetical protein LTR23_006204 [Chaetothyriales sp. CCFEE 6169]KAK5194740.1 hypothetical protein LTR92_005984 [Exophiala xenobiotica]KAK5221734.1 hypothetical protein LTR72_005989 [Exophiala xenobiotica]